MKGHFSDLPFAGKTCKTSTHSTSALRNRQWLPELVDIASHCWHGHGPTYCTLLLSIVGYDIYKPTYINEFKRVEHILSQLTTTLTCSGGSEIMDTEPPKCMSSKTKPNNTITRKTSSSNNISDRCRISINSACVSKGANADAGPQEDGTPDSCNAPRTIHRA